MRFVEKWWTKQKLDGIVVACYDRSVQWSVLARVILTHEIEVLFLGWLSGHVEVEVHLFQLGIVAWVGVFGFLYVVVVPDQGKVYSIVLKMLNRDVERCLEVVTLHVKLERFNLRY